MKRKLIFLFLLFCVFFFGFLSGRYLSFPIYKEVAKSTQDEEIRLGGYKYVSPLLECEETSGINGIELNSLEKDLRDYISLKINDGTISNASVYYRDLNNGPWIGVNEKADYAPASLLKVPTMIALLKEADQDPNFLKKELEYAKHPEALQQNFPPKEKLEYGKKYSVEALLEKMIVQSDNDALLTLADLVPIDRIAKVNEDLGVVVPMDDLESEFLSVKSYSSYFRILYNASYLSPKMSEKALSLLGSEDFYEGIRGGVPKNVAIADKFGERNTPEFKQLHDCGIIYYPKSPYLLCIMTRGKSFDNLSDILSEISGKVYQKISTIH